MMDFLDHMAFTCLAGAAIGLVFLLVGGIFELINHLTKGKFADKIVSFFEEAE